MMPNADLFVFERNQILCVGDSQNRIASTNPFQQVAQSVFDAFIQTPEICSWAPHDSISASNEKVKRFLQTKAKQTTRETEDGKFQRKGKIWPSNAVLAMLMPKLINLGFITEVESSEKLSFAMPFVDELVGTSDKNRLMLKGDKVPKINLDAYHPAMKIALQIEAGQALENKNYLRNFFEAIVLSPEINNVQVRYLGIALCRQRINSSSSGKEQLLDDFPSVAKRLYSLYRSLEPKHLEGVFVISY
jgi:hypothetical protein